MMIVNRRKVLPTKTAPLAPETSATPLAALPRRASSNRRGCVPRPGFAARYSE